MTEFRRTRVVPWRLDAGLRRVAAWPAVMHECNWEIACRSVMGVSKAACSAHLGAAHKQYRGATRSYLSARRISAERGHGRETRTSAHGRAPIKPEAGILGEGIHSSGDDLSIQEGSERASERDQL
ncbi:hypothetical protein Syun_006996 [Stephania yunnanensis]|uniref:Uncharacterized protein n=1 Tax=Stephania yunnanensis TaxID=152371 RepID=A0AAP0KYP5_9MAGN